MTTNRMVALKTTTKATEAKEDTTLTIKEGTTKATEIKVMVIPTTKISPSSHSHQLQGCITTKVPLSTVVTTPTINLKISCQSKEAITASSRTHQEATIHRLRASSHPDPGTMGNNRPTRRSSITKVDITQLELKDLEGTLTGKIQASNQT